MSAYIKQALQRQALTQSLSDFRNFPFKISLDKIGFILRTNLGLQAGN